MPFNKRRKNIFKRILFYCIVKAFFLIPGRERDGIYHFLEGVGEDLEKTLLVINYLLFHCGTVVKNKNYIVATEIKIVVSIFVVFCKGWTFMVQQKFQFLKIINF